MYWIKHIFERWFCHDSDKLLQTIYNNEADLLERVRSHIALDAALSAVTKYGESPLRVSSNNGRFDIVKLLIDSGADKTQLEWTNSFYEVAFGTVASLTQSIAKYKDLEARDYWYRTPWLLSLQVGDIEKVSLLLKLGADRNAVGRCGKQPMAYAIQHNNIKLLQWLVDFGFDIETTDKYLETPLIIASELGMTECAKF